MSWCGHFGVGHRLEAKKIVSREQLARRGLSVSDKKIGVYSAINWLILVPFIIFMTFGYVTYPTYRLSANPVIKISCHKTPEDVYLLLNIRLTNTSENKFESFSVKWGGYIQHTNQFVS